jgi:hypothetical protein
MHVGFVVMYAIALALDSDARALVADWSPP